VVTRALVTLAALAAALIAPAAASGHAQLIETTPQRGAVVDRAPAEVTFRFDEPVEAAFGAVRVYDEEGERVDDGRLTRPGGDGEALATALPADLPDGTYTATFRAISADSHPVSGGFVFTVGEASEAPAQTVSELLADSEAGAVTDVGFGVARAVGYAATAIVVGGLAFLLLVWSPAGDAFSRRLRAVLLGAAGAGALATAAGIVFQGAVASGGTFWAALDPSTVGDVLGTRYGTAAGARLVAWAAILALLAVSALPPRRPVAAGLAVAAAALVVTPGLGGHAGSTGPSWALVPADALHVAAMSAWLGGLALLLLAVPVATRALAPEARTPPLARAVERFSTLALACVTALIATGVLESVLYLDALSDLWGTAWGRAVLIKGALLGALVAVAAYNRQRVRPRLRALADQGRPPGAPGRALRSAVRAEVALAVVVLGVTAALVAYAPAAVDDGVLSVSRALGPTQVEVTASPLRTGPQELHLYLVDPETGAPWTEARRLEATLAQAEREIGPLPVDLEQAGPGHWVASGVTLAVAGDWTLRLDLRLSRFDAYAAEIEVPIE
jgi:copper transport protein